MQRFLFASTRLFRDFQLSSSTLQSASGENEKLRHLLRGTCVTAPSLGLPPTRAHFGKYIDFVVPNRRLVGGCCPNRTFASSSPAVTPFAYFFLSPIYISCSNECAFPAIKFTKNPSFHRRRKRRAFAGWRRGVGDEFAFFCTPHTSLVPSITVESCLNPPPALRKSRKKARYSSVLRHLRSLALIANASASGDCKNVRKDGDYVDGRRPQRTTTVN